ncbi:MAG: ATP-binding protein [Rhodospirillaceae bacterium]|nr:ATP-binding protein [Rhodospirillaceae bacterium]
MPAKSARRLLAWSLGPCVPAWAVLLALYGLERLTWVEALVSAALVFVLMAVLVFARLADFERLIRYAEALFNNPETPAPPIFTSATAQRLLTALNALRRLWTERRDEAQVLARSRQDILDCLPDPLLLLDKQRRVIEANQAAQILLERGLTGLDLASVIRDPKVLEAADAALREDRRTETQFTLTTPVERTFGALLVPLKTPVKDGTALILALQEQTERLKMDRMRADFVANASHELRTPLTAVLGFIETLRGAAKDDAEAREQFLDIMLKQATRMTRLIDDLLSLSRIEMREHARPTEAVDLGNVLRGTADLLDTQAKQKRCEIRIDVPATLPRAIGDASELGQVVFNLAANAIKYGGEGGPVELSAALVPVRPLSMPGQGPCLKIAVRDYGEGIAKEHLPRLTERFYRVDTARSRELGGTGLGLAIVKHITNRHRGALVIESEVGKGSTFSVYLPIASS